MKAAGKFIAYKTASTSLQRQAQHKYLSNPNKAVNCIPDESNTELIDVIEVIQNDEYIYIVVTADDLKQIYWDAYLETSDDGVFMPYAEDNFEGDILGESAELY